MKKVGFLISHKSGEQRRALLPDDLHNIVNTDYLYFEKGYGKDLGFSDNDYEKYGCHSVSREDILLCDIIVDVKLGDADYLSEVSDNKVFFGWAHAVQGIEFTNEMLNHNHTVIAWEEMFEDGRYVFYRNREIAGEAAIIQGFRYCGKMPYDAKVAVIGNGQTAKGALRVLHGLGAEVDVFGRKYEQLFRKKMYEYDVIVNCVMWDTLRQDRLIYKENIELMREGTLIIDVSCDPYLEIETSHPTTIDNPVYVVDGVTHYAVDNTPAMYPKTVSKILSKGISRYIDSIVSENYDETLNSAIVIKNGKIIDERIRAFRVERGLFCK